MFLFTVLFAILWWIPLRCVWNCFAAPFRPGHFRGILSNVPSLLPTFPFNPTRVFPTFNPVKNLTLYLNYFFYSLRKWWEEKKLQFAFSFEILLCVLYLSLCHFTWEWIYSSRTSSSNFPACGAPVPSCPLESMLYTFSCFS